MRVETFKQNRGYFVKWCAKNGWGKEKCKDTWAIILKDIGVL